MMRSRGALSSYVGYGALTLILMYVLFLFNATKTSLSTCEESGLKLKTEKKELITHLSVANEHTEILKKSVDDAQRSLDNCNAARKESEQSRNDLFSKHQTAEAEKKTLEGELADAQKEVTGLRQELEIKTADSTKQNEKFQTEYVALQKEKTQLEALRQDDLAKRDSVIKDLQAEVAALKKSQSSNNAAASNNYNQQPVGNFNAPAPLQNNANGLVGNVQQGGNVPQFQNNGFANNGLQQNNNLQPIANQNNYAAVNNGSPLQGNQLGGNNGVQQPNAGFAGWKPPVDSLPKQDNNNAPQGSQPQLAQIIKRAANPHMDDNNPGQLNQQAANAPGQQADAQSVVKTEVIPDVNKIPARYAINEGGEGDDENVQPGVQKNEDSPPGQPLGLEQAPLERKELENAGNSIDNGNKNNENNAAENNEEGNDEDENEEDEHNDDNNEDENDNDQNDENDNNRDANGDDNDHWADHEEEADDDNDEPAMR